VKEGERVIPLSHSSIGWARRFFYNLNSPQTNVFVHALTDAPLFRRAVHGFLRVKAVEKKVVKEEMAAIVAQERNFLLPADALLSPSA
jgi:hypothetical protein